jgi:hypothetical protein
MIKFAGPLLSALVGFSKKINARIIRRREIDAAENVNGIRVIINATTKAIENRKKSKALTY